MYYLLTAAVTAGITFLGSYYFFFRYPARYSYLKLGKGSTIEPGLIITPVTMVYVLHPSDEDGRWCPVQAGVLAGQPGLHFSRNVRGEINVTPDYGKIDWDNLNAALR